MSFEPVVVETRCDASPEKVWDALTNPHQVPQWFFNIQNFKAEVGRAFRFYESSQKQFLHVIEVTDVDPLKMLQYSWSQPDYAQGKSQVTWELIPEGEKTTVRLTHSNLEVFKDAGDMFAPENFREGWTNILNGGLKSFVENSEPA